MHYPEEFKQYAHPHSGTRIIVGYAGRYAPQEWPKWYSRTMMKWGGESRFTPYSPNDARYDGFVKEFSRQRR
ncbi:unnamed protein product, partial [Mesorhabditis belari]|uniref:Uncharacterized protein n=1 Tax=Mesorhabditis belari TaxID=2138241 RepID=A0AAF3EV16_9BILA